MTILKALAPNVAIMAILKALAPEVAIMATLKAIMAGKDMLVARVNASTTITSREEGKVQEGGAPKGARASKAGSLNTGQSSMCRRS